MKLDPETATADEIIASVNAITPKQADLPEDLILPYRKGALEGWVRMLVTIRDRRRDE